MVDQHWQSEMRRVSVVVVAGSDIGARWVILGVKEKLGALGEGETRFPPRLLLVLRAPRPGPNPKIS